MGHLRPGHREREPAGFVTICPTLAHGGVNNWGSAFLPAVVPGHAARQRQRARRAGEGAATSSNPRLPRDAAAAAARPARRDEPRAPRPRPAPTRRSKAASTRSSWPSACRPTMPEVEDLSQRDRRRRRSSTASTTRSPTTSAGSACWPAGSPRRACGSSRSRTATATCSGTSTTTCKQGPREERPRGRSADRRPAART